MNLTDFQIFSYHLPLKEPLQIGNYILKEREGAILHINSDTGIQGYGEAAPLPGLHPESFQDAIRQLLSIKPLILGKPLKNIFKIIKNLQQENHWFPSVRFAVESALLNLNENSPLQIFKDVLPQSIQNKIHINSLLDGKISSIQKGIEESISKKYQAIKLKVGRRPLDQEIDLVKNIRKEVGNSSLLRLDANRGWTFDEAVAFIESTSEEDIEYIVSCINSYNE